MQNVGLEWTLIDTWVTLGEVSASPSGGAIIPATIKVYSKDKAGTSALYLMDDAGSEREIAPPNTVTGTGTANRLAYWTGTSTIAANVALTQHRLLVADVNGLPQNNAALTSTRIPFSDANGELTDDTTLRFSVAASIPQLFVGSTSALSGSAANAEIDLSPGAGITGNSIFEGAGYGAGAFMNFRGRAARGVQGTGTASQANDILSRFSGLGFGATVFNTGARGALDIAAAENMTDTANGTYLMLKTTPAGSTTMAERLRVTDTTLQPGTTLVMNLGTSALRFLRLWGGDVEMADQAAPSAPASGNAVLFSFNQQGFSVLHVTDSTNAQIEVARDNYIVAKNTSGVTINKGEAVYITGATGNVPNVAKAKADSLTTLPAVGIMFETTTNNSFGRVMYAGNVENFDTSAFTAGDKLWVSTVTAGALTNTRPTPSSTSFPQHIASVLTSGVGNGSIYCNANDVEGVVASDTDPLSQYFLLAGRSGGQVAKGGTAASDNLTLQSTANATKGLIELGSTSGIVYHETDNALYFRRSSVNPSLTAGAILQGMQIEYSTSASANAVIAMDTYTASGAANPVRLIGRAARGTAASPSAVQSGDPLFGIQARGYGATGFGAQVKAGVNFNATENWSDTAQGAEIQFVTCPNTTVSQAIQWKVANDGALLAIASGVYIDLTAITGFVAKVPTDNTDPTGGGGAATGRIPIHDASGNLRYIPYYT